jgi:excisionase family DNA binding protein
MATVGDNRKYSGRFLTPEEVAQILRISVLTVYGYIQRDNLSAVRLGRTYRIAREDLAAFIESKRFKKSLRHANKQPTSRGQDT